MAQEKPPEEGSIKAESGISDAVAATSEASVTDESTPDRDAPLVVEAEAVAAPVMENGPSAEAAPAQPPAAASARRSGILPLVFGGMVVGVIGFGGAMAGLTQFRTDSTGRADQTASDIAANSERIEALSAELDRLAGTPPPEVDLAPQTARIDAIQADIAGLQATIAETRTALGAGIESLAGRIAALESRPDMPGGDPTAAVADAEIESFRRQLEQLTADAEAQVAAARSRAAEIESAAAEAAAEAERQALLARIGAAVDSGAPFADLLTGIEDAPKALTASAGGVATLAALRRDFPDAARAALAATESAPDGASLGERVSAFLRQRTNARSLTPREGDDPDAILSRAEGHLSAGGLDAALGELDALPEAARSAMSGWLERARTRADALEALGAMSSATN